MILRDMLEIHDPESGAIGDCLRATVATLLGLPAEDVPHFVRAGIEAGDCPAGCDDDGTDDHDHGYAWWDSLLDFLMNRGLWVQHLPTDDPPPRPHLASGPGPRGPQHVVAVDADGIVHDPHPSRAGLLDVTWRAEFIDAAEVPA